MNMNEFDVLPRHHYRYEEVVISATPYLAKKACKACYGTGIAGKLCDTKTAATDPVTRDLVYVNKYAIPCSCLTSLPKPKEEEKTDG